MSETLSSGRSSAEACPRDKYGAALIQEPLVVVGPQGRKHITLKAPNDVGATPPPLDSAPASRTLDLSTSLFADDVLRAAFVHTSRSRKTGASRKEERCVGRPKGRVPTSPQTLS